MNNLVKLFDTFISGVVTIIFITVGGVLSLIGLVLVLAAGAVILVLVILYFIYLEISEVIGRYVRARRIRKDT